MEVSINSDINKQSLISLSKTLDDFLINYAPILVFFFIAFFISVFILILAKIRGVSKPDKEKLSPYECGFKPFSDSRMKFNIRFYLIGILFIIFDVEIAFLFPWAIVLKKIGWFGFSSMMFFLLILIVGFIYEWKKGAFEWE